MKLDSTMLTIEINRYDTLIYGKVKEVKEKGAIDKLLQGHSPITLYKNDISDFKISIQRHIGSYLTKWALNIGVTVEGACSNVFSYNFDTPEEAEDFYKSLVTAVLELEESHEF